MSIDTVHSWLLMADWTDPCVSILKCGTTMWRLRVDRSITGRRSPVFLGTRNNGPQSFQYGGRHRAIGTIWFTMWPVTWPTEANENTRVARGTLSAITVGSSNLCTGPKFRAAAPNIVADQNFSVVLDLFISPLERMTCPNHLSRRSRTRMARSHIPSLACSSSIDGSSDGLTPQIQRIIARSLRHSRWRAAEVMGQVSVPCNIELRTLELNRRPLRSKGTGLDVKAFSELTPGTSASSSGSSHAATTSTEHVTQVAETINRLEHTVTNLNLLERAAIDRAYTRHTTTTRAFIGQVLGKCFEARAFPIMNPQVAFGAPDGWPAYSRTTHSTWELAGVLQDIQPKPRSHELCFSHVYMKTLGFQSLLPRLDTFNTFLKRSIAMITRSSAKNSSQGTPTLKSLDKASSTMIKSSGLRTEPWCTPTPTSNSSLYSEPTLTRLRALLYIACTRRTIHSSTPTFLIAHHKTFRGTRSEISVWPVMREEWGEIFYVWATSWP